MAGPRDMAMRRRIRRRINSLLAVVAVAIGSVVGAGSPSGASQPAGAVQSRALGVAPGARYPLTCDGMAIALHDPRFARASFDRTIPCMRGLEAGGGRPRAWRAARRSGLTVS